MENASSPSIPHENPITIFDHLKAIASRSKIIHVVVDFAIRIKNTGVDDPRRMVHSLKVALAITLVSMIYYLQPLYNYKGESGMWAIITVVVVFEYTVGATLSKGINRGFATLLAGALGVGAESFAGLFGQTGKPIVLGCLVFLLVAGSTLSRFIPNIKRRYDYGILIFILTFSLVAVSGYRVDKILKLARERLLTILFGGATCIFISICVCPVWADEELHKLILLNLEKLASFLEGFGCKFYKLSDGDKSLRLAYKSVLNSKATEESLANFAWWEVIGHGKFRFRYPWKQYLKIGDFARQCAYHIEALNRSKFDVVPTEFEKVVEEPCMKMSSEVGKALKELGLSMKQKIYPSSTSAIIHIENCKKVADELMNTTLQASIIGKWDIVETVPVITITAILVDIIKCVESIYEAIEELSKQAHFKDVKSDKGNNTNSLGCDCSGGVVIPVTRECSLDIDVPDISTVLSDDGKPQ